MNTARRTVELLAALLVGAAAGWALLAPIAPGFALGGSDARLTVLATSRPLAAALGVVLAAVVAGWLSRRGSVRVARLVVIVGLGAMVAVAFANESARQLEWLTASSYLTGVAAGLALGGAAATAADAVESATMAAGALAAFLLTAPVTARLGEMADRGWTEYTLPNDSGTFTVAPPWWLLLPAAAATAVALLLGGARAARPSSRAGAVTTSVVVAALVTNAAIGAVPENRQLTWVLLAVFVAVTIAGAAALDGRDGTLLLVTTAVVATAAPLSDWSDTTWIGVVILAVSLAVGVVVGTRWPSVVVGLTLLAAVSLAGLLPDVADGMGDAVRWLALAPIAGYTLGSCGGARSGATVAGVSVLFVPSALTVAGQAAASGPLAELSPFTELPRGVLAYGSPPDPWMLNLTMTVVVLGTIAAAGVLRQRTD
ncbi:hypothetical protein ACWDUM_22765 [Rhodococcus sp. NPDC003322]